MTQRLLIAAFTHIDFVTRRQVCWDTWFGMMLDLLDVKPFFVYGTPPGHPTPSACRAADHWLQTPSLDTYLALPYRTYDLLCYLNEQPDWDYVFKCDDDTYIEPERFMQWLGTVRSGSWLHNRGLQGSCDYMGATWLSNRYASGGEGYLLSRRAVSLMLPHYRRCLDECRTTAEDVMTGMAAEMASIPLHDDRTVFRYHHGPDYASPVNTLMTTHMRFTAKGRLTPNWEDLMVSMHKVFYPHYKNTHPIQGVEPT